ncbi:hypothetical protein H5410_037022 [Solanum commersonii]|uniref:Putative plant transposon protein domain-containing protein n=1 Tax=Solanum commersonii TaxID=4109 RepID=A0A9J5Y9Z1_SOLCO|nr:hypothetical protein H5410_037022 [Solanum commersonii]
MQVPLNDVPTPHGGDQNRWCVGANGKYTRMQKWSMAENGPTNPRRREFSRGACRICFRTFAIIDLRKVWLDGSRPEGRLMRRLCGTVKPQLRDPLALVEGALDISLPTCPSRRFLCGPSCGSLLVPQYVSLTLRWDIVRSGAFGGITAARGCDTLVGQIHSCGWARVREWVLCSAFGHEEGDALSPYRTRMMFPLMAVSQNRWCVEGQWQIYRDAKMVNEKQKMARLITEERRVLTGSLHTVPDIHRLFNLHKCDWMARDPGTYSEEIVREFYASYAATLRGSISKRSKPLAQDPLTSTLVRGCPVDISPATIRRFLYGPTAGHSWSLNTAKFDYRWDIVRSGAFQRNSEQQEVVIHWLDKYITADGDRAEWVAAPRLGIRKATLTFMAKFFWLLVRNRVSPTKADNQVTWDRAVMVAALVAGVKIDFADSGVPIWHCDTLVHPTALDIGPFDEANVATPVRASS